MRSKPIAFLFAHLHWASLLSALVLLFAAAGIPRISISSDYRVFFSEDNPELQAFEQQEALFYQSENIIFALQGDIYSADSIAAIGWLTEQAWSIPYSLRVDSLSNYQYADVEDEELTIADLVIDPSDISEAGLQQLKKRADTEPAIRNRLVNTAGDANFIIVTEQLPGENRQREVPEVMAKVDSIAAVFRQRWPQIKLSITGMVPFNAMLTEATIHDLVWLLPISFGLMILMLGWLLRGLLPVAITMAVVAASVALAMGLAGWTGLVLNTATAAAPLIILTLAIAHSVHLFVSFNSARSHAADPSTAITEALRVNLEPVTITSLTTAIGFLSMNFSDAPPFRELGNVVAVGVMGSWWFALTLLPTLVQRFHQHLAPPPPQDDNAAMARFGHWVNKHQRLLLGVMLIICAPVVALAFRNEINDQFRLWYPPGNEVRDGMEVVLEKTGGLQFMHYTLDSGASGGVTEQAFFTQAEAFSNWLFKQKEVAHVQSFTDVLKRMNQALKGGSASQFQLPANNAQARQFLTVYELSLPQGMSLNNLVDLDKRRTRLTVTMRRTSGRELRLFDQRAIDWLNSNAPAIQSSGGSGTPKMFAELGQRNIRSMLLGSSLALVMISLLMMLALRSFRIGLLSLVPNLLPPALGFGIWALIDGQITIALSVVMGMTLGIIVDDSVHFLSKYLRARRERGLAINAAVVYAFDHVGRALWVTTMVLVVGFTVLAFSGFQPTAGMAQLTAITIAVALIADFLLLPPLLHLFDRQQRGDDPTTSPL